MKIQIKALASAIVLTLGLCGTAMAGEGRYQAHWNGKSYLILDSDHGHIWTYFGDSILYNGRIDANDFEPPEKTKIWQQSHGKWIRK